MLGIATALAWQHRREPAVLWFIVALVLVTTGFAAWLLPSAGTGLPAALVPVLVVLGVASAGVLAVSAWRRGAAAGAGPSSGLALLAAGMAVLAAPAVASIGRGRGTRAVRHAIPADGGDELHPWRLRPATVNPPGLALLESARQGAPYLMAAQTSALASGFVYATGQEVLPLGGYTGTTPEPSLQLARVDGVTRAVPRRAHDRSRTASAASQVGGESLSPCPETVSTGSAPLTRQPGPGVLLPTALGLGRRRRPGDGG